MLCQINVTTVYSPVKIKNCSSKIGLMPTLNINRELMNELRPHQDELMQLADLAGIHMDKDVFRCLVHLLNMGVSPYAIFNLLKNLKKKLDPSKSRKSNQKGSVAKPK